MGFGIRPEGRDRHRDYGATRPSWWAEDEDPEYYINEAQTLLIYMLADTDKAKVVRGEIIEIVKARLRLCC